MIVFLIANKISSFGVGDEEEKREEWDKCRTERRWTGRPVSFQKRRRSTSHLLCRGSGKRDNVFLSAVTQGQMGSSLSQSFSSGALSGSSQTAVTSHQAHTSNIKLR